MSSIRLHQLQNMGLDPMPIPLNTITVWLTFYAQFPLYKLTNIDSFKGIGENLTLFASLFILIELVLLISELFSKCKNSKYFSRYCDKRKRDSLVISPILTLKMAILGIFLCNEILGCSPFKLPNSCREWIHCKIQWFATWDPWEIPLSPFLTHFSRKCRECNLYLVWGFKR